MVDDTLAHSATVRRRHSAVANPRQAAGRRSLRVGIVQVVIAVTLFGAIKLAMAGAGVLGLAAGLLGVVLLYLGSARICRFLFGAQFDLALWLSAGFLIVMALAAIFADWLPLAESRDVSKTLFTPALLRPDLLSAHPLGTDRQGLDILGGVIYGARVSLTVAIGAVAIGLSLGGGIGLVAGYYRGRVDAAVGLLTDAMLAFPPLILLMALVTILDPSVTNVTLALGVLGVPTYIRLARANTMAIAQREFVLAARVVGANDGRIIFRELLPNVALPLASYAFLIAGVLIVAEASLSYLGLSIPRPNPTWGNMIAAGQDSFRANPHTVLVPGVVLFLTVFALNRVGDKARQLWDPRESKV